MNRSRPRSALRVLVAIGLALVGTQAEARDDRLAVEVMNEGGLSIQRLELPGQLEAARVHCPGVGSGEAADGSGGCALFLALGPSPSTDDNTTKRPRARATTATQRSIYRVDLPSESSPAGAEAVQLGHLQPPRLRRDQATVQAPPNLQVVRVSGRDQLLAEWQGRVHLRPLDSTWQRQEPDLELPGPSPWRSIVAIDGPSPQLSVIDVGELWLYELAQPGTEAQRIRIPLQAKPANGDLVLVSPRASLVGDEAPKLVIGPEPHGSRRLRSLVVNTRDEVEGEPQESWSALPDPESVTASEYWSLGNRSLLAVVTQRSDRLGLFERKKLRLFELGADRTRSGSSPSFAVRTASRLWQRLTATLVERDQEFDLVLVQPEGLGGGKLAIDRYRGSARTFEPKASRTLVQVPESWWHYGQDWTGDGELDLVTLHSGVLRVFAGQGSSEKRPLANEPEVELELLDAVRPLTKKERKRKQAETEDASVPRRRQANVRQGWLLVRSVDEHGQETLEIVGRRGGEATEVRTWQLSG